MTTSFLAPRQAGYIGRDPKDGRLCRGREKLFVAKSAQGGIMSSLAATRVRRGRRKMQQGYHSVLDPLVAKGDVKIVMDQFTPAWKTEPGARPTPRNALTANNNKVERVPCVV